MTKPINLYIQSRISDETVFNRIERHAASKTDKSKTKTHEISSLRALVDALIKQGVQPDQLDSFYYGYEIPQIGKEFDLLKFGIDECLNIELKSRRVSDEQISTQLRRNQYYLGHLGKRLIQYTVVTSSLACYSIDAQGNIFEVSISDLATTIKSFESDLSLEIDKMFRASDFLVSPLNTPEKFIEGQYFLTQAQEHIKTSIIVDISKHQGAGFFSITGKPGTGKTLLLYDVAKALAKQGDTLVLHCGKLAEGQIKLNESIPNFKVVSTGQLKYNPDIADSFKYVLVDESHRIYPNQFEALCESVLKHEQICVFSSDPEQVLSSFEHRNGITQKILELPLVEKYELSEKIRTNKELASFILSVRNLSHKPHEIIHYDNVSLAYANDVEEAKVLIQLYKQQGYTFINYSKSNYRYSPYSTYEEDFDTHHVIGQEFDNVLMLLDKSFFYDKDGKLQGIPHPNPDYLYPNLFYQGITRVREKIALIVVGSPELFDKISSVVEIRS